MKKNRKYFIVMASLVIVLLFCFANQPIAYYGLIGPYGSHGGYGSGVYLGMPTLGLSSLYNPLSYYSYGSGLFSPFYNLDPLSDSLLGLGMFPEPLCKRAKT